MGVASCTPPPPLPTRVGSPPPRGGPGRGGGGGRGPGGGGGHLGDVLVHSPPSIAHACELPCPTPPNGTQMCAISASRLCTPRVHRHPQSLHTHLHLSPRTPVRAQAVLAHKCAFPPVLFSPVLAHLCAFPPQSLCALVHLHPIFAHARACALSPCTMSVLRSLHTRVHFCAPYFCTPTHIYTPSPCTLVLTSVLAHQCMCTPTPCTCTCPAPPPLTCTHSICMAMCAPTRVCHFGGEGGR